MMETADTVFRREDNLNLGTANLGRQNLGTTTTTTTSNLTQGTGLTTGLASTGLASTGLVGTTTSNVVGSGLGGTTVYTEEEHHKRGLGEKIKGLFSHKHSLNKAGEHGVVEKHKEETEIKHI